MNRIKAASSPLLAIAAGLCTGQAIRSALHHGHAWLWLALAALIGWGASFAILYMPYRAERHSLLRKRAILLSMQAELNSIVAAMFKPGSNKGEGT